MTRYYLVMILPFILCCTAAKKSLTEGVILHKARMYDKKGNELLIRYQEKDMKIWFRDSCVIFEIFKLNMFTDEHDKETWTHTVLKYTYLDLKTKIFYDYNSFTDTAKLQKRYNVPDSENVGWNFYRDQSLFNLKDSLAALKDTVINTITYKRLGGINNFPGADGKPQQMTYVYYMRCDKTNSLFHIDKPFDDRIKGCPATRFDFFIPGNSNIISTEYNYSSDSLTTAERQIFSQWAKNAYSSILPLEHPQQKETH